VLLDHSIQPIQQFAYTSGKNATDSAMIIDAMDLLYSSRFDGFCIVSSDSDFTRLASRIREAGLTVYGFGERKTPQPFVSACDKFIYTDRLVGTVESAPEVPKVKRSSSELRSDTKLLNLLRNAIDAASDENGWAALSTVGGILNKRSPDFDARDYGYSKFSGLINAIGLYDMEDRQIGNGKHPFVRVKAKGK